MTIKFSLKDFERERRSERMKERVRKREREKYLRRKFKEIPAEVRGNCHNMRGCWL